MKNDNTQEARQAAEEARRVCEGATDGPFHAYPVPEAVLEKFAAARTLLPALAGHVDTLLGENERMREALISARKMVNSLLDFAETKGVFGIPSARRDINQEIDAALTPAAGKGKP